MTLCIRYLLHKKTKSSKTIAQELGNTRIKTAFATLICPLVHVHYDTMFNYDHILFFPQCLIQCIVGTLGINEGCVVNESVRSLPQLLQKRKGVCYLWGRGHGGSRPAGCPSPPPSERSHWTQAAN